MPFCLRSINAYTHTHAINAYTHTHTFACVCVRMYVRLLILCDTHCILKRNLFQLILIYPNEMNEVY